MELLTIGAAARLLGVNTSALRYYEERGLVRPAERRGGRRMYGPEQLRRLAFVQFMQRLGVSLEAAAAVLDGPSEQWRGAVREQLTALDVLIARAGAARDFLQHAVDCPADHPVDECPFLVETLDRRLAGSTIEELAAERGVTVPADPPSRTARAHR